MPRAQHRSKSALAHAGCGRGRHRRAAGISEGAWPHQAAVLGRLPQRSRRRGRPFGAVFVPPNSGRTVLEEPPRPIEAFEWDLGSQRLTVRSTGGGGRYRLNAIGTEMGEAWSEVTQIVDNDPTSAQSEFRSSEGYKRGDWDVNIKTVIRLSVTKDDFLLVGDIKAYDHDQVVFAKNWDRKIRRVLV
jgi:uncharacterized protein